MACLSSNPRNDKNGAPIESYTVFFDQVNLSPQVSNIALQRPFLLIELSNYWWDNNVLKD